MRWMFLLSLVACVEDAPHSLPADQLAEPFGMTLSLSPAFAGETMTAFVANVPIGSEVTLYGSIRGAGPGPCHPFGACLGILDPIPLATGIAPPPPPIPPRTQTDVLFELQVPAHFSGQEVWLQAMWTHLGYAGDHEQVFIRIDDPDLDGHLGADDNCPNTFNPAQTDGDGDSFGSACDCHDDVDWAFPDRPGADPADGIDANCDGIEDPTIWWDEIVGNYIGPIELGPTISPFCRSAIDIEVFDDGTLFSSFRCGGTWQASGQVSGDRMTGEICLVTLTGCEFFTSFSGDIGIDTLSATFEVDGDLARFSGTHL